LGAARGAGDTELGGDLGDPSQRAEVLTAVAGAVAAAGDPDRAEQIARGITNPSLRSRPTW
jgi:hypothetical protein